MSGVSERVADHVLDWPTEQSFYLTLDFERDFGTALEPTRFDAVDHTGELIGLLEEFGVPLTCFVQTELLDVRPAAVERLRSSEIDVKFHPHSHTHAVRTNTSMPEEVATSTTRYRDFFGHEPVGYRFPNGNIRPADYALLANHGYEFDASLFPSWRPGHFNNSRAPTRPRYLPEYDVLELPFTVYSDTVRIPTALSYCRLIGWPYTLALARRPPSNVVFNIHMHDLFTPPSFDELPLPYRLIYRRNDNGFDLFVRILHQFEALGYDFRTLDEVHEAGRAVL